MDQNSGFETDYDTEQDTQPIMKRLNQLTKDVADLKIPRKTRSQLKTAPNLRPNTADIVKKMTKRDGKKQNLKGAHLTPIGNGQSSTPILPNANSTNPGTSYTADPMDLNQLAEAVAQSNLHMSKLIEKSDTRFDQMDEKSKG